MGITDFEPTFASFKFMNPQSNAKRHWQTKFEPNFWAQGPPATAPGYPRRARTSHIGRTRSWCSGRSRCTPLPQYPLEAPLPGCLGKTTVKPLKSGHPPKNNRYGNSEKKFGTWLSCWMWRFGPCLDYRQWNTTLASKFTTHASTPNIPRSPQCKNSLIFDLACFRHDLWRQVHPSNPCPRSPILIKHDKTNRDSVFNPFILGPKAV